MRVLLVEDDRRLSQSLKMSLMDEGYAVDAAFDGAEGEEFAEVVSYDAIILDVMLPVKDGVAVCRSLRARKMKKSRKSEKKRGGLICQFKLSDN